MCLRADGLAHVEDTQGFITMRPLPVCVPMTEQACGPPGHFYDVRVCCSVFVSPSVSGLPRVLPQGCLHFPPRVYG